MPNFDPNDPNNSGYRAWIGMTLVGFVLAAILVIAVAVIVAGALQGKLLEASNSLLSTLLPMFGTWVGTVLAFYFTKENFESANRATQDLVRTAMQRLQATGVTEKMIPRGSIVALQVADMEALKAKTLKDLETAFAQTVRGGRINRLPVFAGNGACIAVVHRSLWQEMLVLGYRAATPAPPDTTFGTLLALTPDGETRSFETLVTDSIAWVGAERSLADAKEIGRAHV